MLLGKSKSGKSALLQKFLLRPFCDQYNPTHGTSAVVNSVDLPGGKQCYLIVRPQPDLTNP